MPDHAGNPGPDEVISRNPLLAFVLCRHEAIHRAGLELRRRELVWESLPHLRHLAEDRPEDYDPKPAERVNFSKPLRQCAKARLPDYRLDVRELTLSKALSADVEFRLIFDRPSRGGSGKRFDVRLDIHTAMPPGTAAGWVDFFALFQRGHMKWVYHTQAELDHALDAAFDLFFQALPVLEEHCRRLLVPLPTRVPDDVPRRGALTARGGFDEARSLVSQFTGGASLPLLRARASRDLWVQCPTIGFDGKLNVQSAWHYQFYWAARRQAAWAIIPAIGSPRIQFTGVPPTIDSYLALPDHWIDSDHAMKISEDIRRRHHAPDVEIGEIFPTLEGPRSRAPFPTPEDLQQSVWKIHYQPNHRETDPEPDLFIPINAVTGEPVDEEDR